MRKILDTDKWVEDYDFHSGHMFYYNVTTGARQWEKPPVQPWHITDGRFVPMTKPVVYPSTNAGELDAHRAETARLRAAQLRAGATNRITEARRKGEVTSAALAGKDVGPASAKVIPGSARVAQTDGNAPGDVNTVTGLWRRNTLVEPPPQKAGSACIIF